MRVPDLADGDMTLRPFAVSDADMLVATIDAHRDISYWTRIPWPYEPRHALEFIARSQVAWRTGTDASFAIVERGGELVGSVGIHRIGAPHRPRSAMLPDEVGYWLSPAARGRGVATRAVRLVAEWALGELARPAVHLQVKDGNVASQRVAERAGFEYLGFVPGTEVDDDDDDHHRYVRRDG
jgi:ribosomal-protein-alanine N-acetyltransferase